MIDLLTGLFNAEVGDTFYLDSIYSWMQEQAGVAKDKIQPLTIGRLSMLMAAFPTTVTYKALFGQAPFPGGKAPVLADLNPDATGFAAGPTNPKLACTCRRAGRTPSDRCSSSARP